MSSREIAELTGKEHFHVKRDIRNMLEDLGEDASSFGGMSQDTYGRPLEVFSLPKELTITLVSGYSVVMRHRIVTRWLELEKQAQPAIQVPTSLVEALRLAADKAEEAERVTVQRAIAVRSVQLEGATADSPTRLGRSSLTPIPPHGTKKAPHRAFVISAGHFGACACPYLSVFLVMFTTPDLYPGHHSQLAPPTCSSIGTYRHHHAGVPQDHQRSHCHSPAHTITPPQEVDHRRLSADAHELVVQLLESRGNCLSDSHAWALLKMMELLAGYASGTEPSRKAFPLPTGMGKTTGVIAFITAAHRLGYRIPMAVAASQVQSLVTLKRDLVALGVPVALIGLAHRDQSAEEPSTGCRPEDGRLIQLVTHARVRMGEDYLGLFAQYQGKPRSVLVYDETLFRSDSFAFLSKTLGAATAALGHEGCGKDSLHAPMVYLGNAVRTIEEALSQARQTEGPSITLALSEVHPEVLDLWKASVSKAGLPRAYVEVLQQFLGVSQLPLQVLPMTQGGGAVAVRQAVSDQLERVVILDASTPIRDLVAMDSTIDLYADIPKDIKSFEQVEVKQLMAAGGRSSIEQSFTETRRETSAVSREVLAVVRDELEADPLRCFLFFTFKKSSRSDLDIKARLREDLKAAGLDPEDQVIVEGQERPRFAFLHWGQHEGINGFEYCKTVILAGVLHRSHLDIAAHIKGQKMDLLAATSLNRPDFRGGRLV